MQKKLGAIMLVAGTCIGGGMIALPMVLAKIGIIPSIILMLIIWALMYYISLIHIELNLQAKQALSLGGIGKYFSGKTAELIGVVTMKILTYALLAVFIYGGSSVIQKLCGSNVSFTLVATIYSFATILLLMLPIKLIDYVNRILFLGLIAIVGILTLGLGSMIKLKTMPLIGSNIANLEIWQSLIPVVFTSFGFQAIIQTVTSYCNRDAKILKAAFLWGSFIPAVIYIIWTCSILTLVNNENPVFYNDMVLGKVEIGDLIQELSRIAKWESIQLLIWWISILAIVTSLIGIGLGLCQSVNDLLKGRVKNLATRDTLSAIITVLPAYIIAVLVPNAFITVLAFASILIVITAILLPAYLLYKAKIVGYYYPELEKNYLLIASILAGIIVMSCEVLNII